MTLAQKHAEKALESTKTGQALDLYSIRQTNLDLDSYAIPDSGSAECTYHAPFFAVPAQTLGYYVFQGNCHHWDCPRCGIGRAKYEYKRILNGVIELSETCELYFMTITCRGRDVTQAEADENYYAWTNKLLTACRTRAKRAGRDWHYIQVTERQKRGHPHSHIICTWCPHDVIEGETIQWVTEAGNRVSKIVPTLRSAWFAKRLESAGLGSQYDIGEIESVEGASKYVAKYMFKADNFSTDWPDKWRRVRYSNSFPKLPERETSDAIVLIKDSDWYDLASKTLVVRPMDAASAAVCTALLAKHDVIIKKLKTEVDTKD